MSIPMDLLGSSGSLSNYDSDVFRGCRAQTGAAQLGLAFGFAKKPRSGLPVLLFQYDRTLLFKGIS